MGISIDMCIHLCLNECMGMAAFLAMCVQICAGVQDMCTGPGICTEQKNALVQIAEDLSSGRGMFIDMCNSICEDSRVAIHVDELGCICSKTCTPM